MYYCSQYKQSYAETAEEIIEYLKTTDIKFTTIWHCTQEPKITGDTCDIVEQYFKIDHAVIHGSTEFEAAFEKFKEQNKHITQIVPDLTKAPIQYVKKL